MRRGYGRFGVGLGLAAAVLTLACADQRTPTGPGASGATHPSADLNQSGLQLPVLQRTAPLPQDITTSATIGLAGGVLAIPAAGLTVVIPPLALTRPTQITLTANAGSLVSYSFEPHGTTFTLPIEVMQTVAGTAASGNPPLLASLVGGYLANGTSDISPAGIATIAQLFPLRLLNAGGLSLGPVVVFATSHFSGYILGSGFAGGTDTTTASDQ